MRILNGRFLGDLNGKSTCFKWNGISTVDYSIVHKDLLNKIEFIKVSELVGHTSDHCPISFGVKLSYQTTEFKHDIYPLKPNFRWDDQSKFNYKSALSSDNIVNQINSILQSNETDVCIDEILSKVETVLNSAVQRALKERKIGSKSKTKKGNGLTETVTH